MGRGRRAARHEWVLAMSGELEGRAHEGRERNPNLTPKCPTDPRGGGAGEPAAPGGQLERGACARLGRGHTYTTCVSIFTLYPSPSPPCRLWVDGTVSYTSLYLHIDVHVDGRAAGPDAPPVPHVDRQASWPQAATCTAGGSFIALPDT
eukprot:scaffold884_cov398-Prasinococcus_capsulatus_cf.AAC.16